MSLSNLNLDLGTYLGRKPSLEKLGFEEGNGKF
jgi:hypothetical protein